MIASQQDRLNHYTSEYLSIGITIGGEPRTAVGVPWEATAHAFNMRIPEVYIAPEDLQDEAIMGWLESYTIIGCYIWAPLNDYRFLVRFKDLEDINIKNGDALRNLDFLSGHCKCRMLYLQKAKLKNLNIIVDVKNNSKTIFGCLRCVGLDDCEVEDLSVFETGNVHFSEFLIWKTETSNERDRWNVISANTRRYFEFKE